MKQKSVVEKLIEAENLAYPRGLSLYNAFWPMFSEDQKREYMYLKYNMVFCGNVDEMTEQFAQEIR